MALSTTLLRTSFTPLTTTTTTSTSTNVYTNTTFNSALLQKVSAPLIVEDTIEESNIVVLAAQLPSTPEPIEVFSPSSTTSTTFIPAGNPIIQPTSTTNETAIEEVLTTINETIAETPADPLPTIVAPSPAPPSSGDLNLSLVVSSSFFGEDFFNTGTMVSAPIRSDLLEFSSKEKLTESEKPRVLGNIIEDVRTDGFGRRNSLIIKKMNSTRGRAIKYSIFRKNMLKDADFIKVAEIDPKNMSVQKKYLSMLQNFGLSEKDTFIFTDHAITINTIFVYKVQVDWVFNKDYQNTTQNTSAPTEPAPAQAPTNEQNVISTVVNIGRTSLA